MGKKIKLGGYEPTLMGVEVYALDESNLETKLIGDHYNTIYGITIKADMAELGQSIAYLKDATDGKTTAADFVNTMIKSSPDILDDQVFEIAKVALKACLSRVSKQEGMYYHPLAAALAVCEDIIQNQ